MCAGSVKIEIRIDEGMSMTTRIPEKPEINSIRKDEKLEDNMC